MSEFLLEIGCEEIPAGMLEPAATALKDVMAKELASARIAADHLQSYYTPRRLVLYVPSIVERQADLVETIVGPPKTVAFDKEGHPTKAATAFADKHNVPLKKVKIVTTEKGEYLGLEKKTKGEKTARVLPGLLPKIIGAIPFPKTMSWTDDGFRFARPIRWLLALLDGRVVKFDIAGVRAGNRTYGHRMLGKKRLAVKSFDEFKRGLYEGFVVIDPVERRQAIENGMARVLDRLTEQHGYAEIFEDEDLLREVTNLNEYPQVILGDILLTPEEFELLPNEVLMTVMRKHQKYFSLLDRQQNLYRYFLAVVNTSVDNPDIYKTISGGHARVLRARLDDAIFFWKADRKIKLAERKERLRHVLFMEKLGSFYDKTERIAATAERLAEILQLDQEIREPIRQAAGLVKVDLVTEMVKELTELQGIMGGLYARAEGYPEKVWRAIYEHYQPKNLEERVPSTTEGAVLSIADKIDTIVGCFGIGQVPKGSRDPLALRRLGNGIIRIILDHRLEISLTQIIDSALKALSDKVRVAPGDLMPLLMEFFEGRIRYILSEARGFSQEEINATMAAGFDAPYDLSKRIEALSRIRPEEDFLAIATAYKRIKNILRDQAVAAEDGIRADLLQEEAERALYALCEEVNPKIAESIGRFDYYTALKHMASMRRAIDLFFDKVLVMAEDEALRTNRIRLLRRIANTFSKVADISEIVVEKSTSK
jgi:glycyl-tRNA synthetase beta chain